MRLGLIAAAALLSGIAVPASAAGFVNGGFEAGTCGAPAGSFTPVAAGNPCITGWTVESGSVDWINGYWQAHDGTHSIDLAGNQPGSISQIFDTVAGQLYSVDYWLSGNPDGGDALKWGLISAVDGGVVASATFLGLQGTNRGVMNYNKWNFQFTATGPSTKLTFASDPTEGYFGAVLDSVSVSAVPEPSTWAMLLLGFFGLGAVQRRSRKTKVPLAAFA
jgi:choice-of-anchor C domain-containing protein